MQQEDKNKRFIEEGIFTYNSDGFDIMINGVSNAVKWNDIVKLTAYKVALFTFDEIHIEILLENERIIISEETKGWYQFIEKFTTALKGVNAGWEDEVTKEAFATNCALIYEKIDE